MTNKFYMLFVENTANAPKKQHYEYQDAIIEAQRLMKQTQKRVYILEATHVLIPKLDYEIEFLTGKPEKPKSVIVKEGCTNP